MNRIEETKDYQNNCKEDDMESENIIGATASATMFEVHEYDLSCLESGLILLWSVTSEKFISFICNSKLSENFKTFEEQMAKIS